MRIVPAALLCAAALQALTTCAEAAPPHVLFVVGDDVGYADLGHFNDRKTATPVLDSMIESGIMMADYYTFKICSPSRAAMMTGRYPWGAGFYNMNQDTDHCTTNSTLLPQLLKREGYSVSNEHPPPPRSPLPCPIATHRPDSKHLCRRTRSVSGM